MLRGITSTTVPSQPAMAYGGSEFISAFGGIAEMAGFAAGSTRSRMIRNRHGAKFSNH
jgi:hypothetical protein